MFKKARLRLTAWYLLIIMTVSLSFSTVIFQAVSTELERFSRLQQFRFQRQVIIEPNDPDLLIESKHRLLLFLSTINASIFVLAGALGYFLAGRTLEPIEKMMEEQNQFVSDSSHELRTPITALKSSLEVALRDKHFSVGMAKDTLKDSLEEVNRLQSLSEKLLSLSHYQNRASEEVKSVPLENEINKAISTIQILAKQKKISIKSSVQNILFLAQGNSIVELLSILLENAIQYSKPGTKIWVKAKKTDSSVIIGVKDQGVGIGKHDLPHIFDRFYRADSSRTIRSEKGYGLGLSIAAGIVERYHGKIKVDSKLGKGSNFIIELPLK